ncbi:hypothetical protein D3C83_249410 [compost metagenome]
MGFQPVRQKTGWNGGSCVGSGQFSFFGHKYNIEVPSGAIHEEKITSGRMLYIPIGRVGG